MSKVTTQLNFQKLNEIKSKNFDFLLPFRTLLMSEIFKKLKKKM